MVGFIANFISSSDRRKKMSKMEPGADGFPALQGKRSWILRVVHLLSKNISPSKVTRFLLIDFVGVG
jgi:hypothetical protein